MLSVVIIGMQAAPLLPGCLDSIAQCLAEVPHEVLYVDGGSADDSVAIAQERGARVFTRVAQDGTAALGRYIGTREARGDVLLFLDHDMRLQPGFVERACEAMQQQGWAGAVGIRDDVFLRSGEETGRMDNVFGCTQQREAPVFGGALLVEKAALERAGGWDPDVATNEEVELYARLKQAGARIVELPVPMIRHLDEQRDNRSLWRVLWNTRRLGLGQALAAALRKGSAGALIRLEWKAFALWLLDMLSLVAVCAFGWPALWGAALLQGAALAALYLRGQGRSYVTYTLLLIYLPAGMLSRRRQDRGYENARKEKPMQDLPRVSVAVVAFNASATLHALLAQIEAQDYPHDRMELLLVNSASTDDTRAIMQAFAEKTDISVRVLENPLRNLPAGCNVALRAYSGDLFIRLDAHSVIAPDFIRVNVQEIQKGRDIVGGYVTPVEPDSNMAAVLAALDASRFCGGVARFRNRGKERNVDTLAFAMYRRKVYETVGLYDERLERTEDNDMACRIRKAGFVFFYTPKIHSQRHPRATLGKMLGQKWDTGVWISRTMFVQPWCFSLRHFVPVAFVLALLGCLVALCFGQRLPLLLLLGIYLVCDVYFAVEATLQQPKAKGLTLLLLPALFPMAHLCYGAGTLAGIKGGPALRKRPSQAKPAE